jgi:hypothetical protein
MKPGSVFITRKNSFSTGSRDSEILRTPPVEEENMMQEQRYGISRKLDSNEEMKIIEPTWEDPSQESFGQKIFKSKATTNARTTPRN